MLKCIDVSLGLSLGLLITGITSTKLALRSIRLMWCGGWCGPTKVPHRIRKSGPATRKHGNSGRQVKRKVQQFQKRCIHISCNVPDQALRPSVVMSQPCKRLTWSTLELRAHLNLTRNQKRSITTPARMSFALHLECHDMKMATVSLLSDNEGRMLTRLQATGSRKRFRKSEASHSGKLL